jgi:hypothetical protein
MIISLPPQSIELFILLFVFFLKLGYICCTWGIHSDSSKCAYILHCIDFPMFSPPGPLPAPLEAIISGFLVLFIKSVWSPSTIFPHFNLLLHHSLFHKYFFQHSVSILHPIIYESIFKGVLSVSCFVYTLLWSVQHHLLLSLTP